MGSTWTAMLALALVPAAARGADVPALPGGAPCSGTITLDLDKPPLDIPDLGFRWAGMQLDTAPAGATTTGLEYSLVIDDTGNPSSFYAGDYEIYLSSETHGGPNAFLLVYDNCGRAVDSGCDDDPENDSDIEITGRITHFFDGEDPNQWWYVWIQDVGPFDVGQLEALQFIVSWSVECTPAACGQPGSGDCFRANGSPACEDETCCAAICAVDPFCCETAWDALCAEQAQKSCTALNSCPNDVNGNGVVDFADVLLILLAWGPCTCPEDVNADGAADFADVLAVLIAWGPCPTGPGACCNPLDGTCSVMPESACLAAGGAFAGEGTDCTDTDGDRIPDAFELGDCSANAPACFAGTDPNVADTDGDGIGDGDELYGTTGGLDLPALGVDPCRKDVLVELDYLYGTGQESDRNRLHPDQAQRIIAAFADGTTANPNGTTGITIHLDYGQPPYGGGNAVADTDETAVVGIDSFAFEAGEFYDIKAANFAPNRNGYFHYCIMADKYAVGGTPSSSSGLAELPGDDLIVSLGQVVTGDHDFIGNTIMHELGHNLLLRHGGFENRNYKPNYNSVMNYRHQFCGADTDGDSRPDGALDYSRGLNLTLDESSLVEMAGVTGSGPAIDWNGDGDTLDTVSLNVNCGTASGSSCAAYASDTAACGTMGNCNDDVCSMLADYDDWTGLELDHLDDGDGPREVIHCALPGALAP